MMKMRLVLATLLIVSAALTGCGSKADRLVQKQIRLMNDMADAIESGASEAELENLQQEGQKLGKQIADLTLSETEKKQLIERHQQELTEASSRLAKAMMGKLSKDMEDAMNKGQGGTFPGMPSF